MKRRSWIVMSFLALLSASGCERQQVYTGKLVLEGSHRLESGVVEEAHLLMLGGDYHIENGAELHGSAVLILGTLAVDGQIHGDVSQYGGVLVAGPEGRINGYLNLAGGEQRGPVERAAAGGLSSLEQPQPPLSPGWQERSSVQELLWPIGQAVLAALLAALAARFIPRPLQHIAVAIQEHAIVALSLGLLAGVVGLVLLVQMIFTVILIPVTALGLVALALTVAYGWSGFGLILGRVLFQKLNWQASLPRQTFAGTLLFMLLVALIGGLPLFGDLLVILSTVTGAGAVLLTRYGLVPFVPADY